MYHLRSDCGILQNVAHRDIVYSRQLMGSRIERSLTYLTFDISLNLVIK